MMKRVTLPSVAREVRTRQHGSSSGGLSTPKQLTYTHEEIVLSFKKKIIKISDSYPLTLMLFLKV